MSFQPIHNRIALYPLVQPTKQGSIYIPDIAQDRERFRVVAVGNSPHLTVKVGDHVIVSSNTGVGERVLLDSRPHLIVRESEVLAIIETA